MQIAKKERVDLESLSGTIDRITFYSEESGFAVLRVKVSKKRDLLTVTGNMPFVAVGEYIYAKGIWCNDSKHGLQFKAEFLKAIRPNTLDGIEKYLGSGLIKGIGPHFAKKLVLAFKERVFNVIEESADLLSSIPGIGKIRASTIINNWAEQKVVRDIMVFLQSHGVSTARATRIYKTYGEDAIKIVSENPYRLAKDIHGIGFLSADKIAMRIGIEEHSLIRARSGMNYTLMDSLSEGNCGLARSDLLLKAEKLLAIPGDILLDALAKEITEQSLVTNIIDDKEIISLAAYASYENSVAKCLKSITCGIPVWSKMNIEKAIEWVEKKLLIELALNQKEAIKQVINNKITVITGGPGTGKTTLLNSLVKILQAGKYRILLSAPTGRAAKRLSESTGSEAITVHRLLKFDPGTFRFKYNQDNPLNCDALIIDECSMIDIQLMYNIMKALPKEACLILVGDVDQLPSVGPGQVLKDIIDSGSMPVVRLTEIFRQSKTSAVISNAHRINAGVMPNLDAKENTDFYYIPADTPENIVQKVIALVSKRIPAKFKYNPISDMQVLTPMQRGGCGVISLNIELQRVLNPNTELYIERFGSKYYIGDKIMQTVNNYDKEVYNGDLGFVNSIDQENQEVTIRFDDREVKYDFNELDEITLAYAITIHKSQGSEYPVVVLPIAMHHYMMLKRNLLYTGVTRGKKLVILVGQKKAIAIAVKSSNQTNRITRLKELLQSHYDARNA